MEYNFCVYLLDEEKGFITVKELNDHTNEDYLLEVAETREDAAYYAEVIADIEGFKIG